MRNFGVMTGSLLCLGVLGFADVDVRDQPQYNQNPGSPTTNIYIDENKNNDGFPLEPYPLFWGGAPFLWGGIWYNSYDDWNHGYNNYYNYDYHPNEAAQDQRIQNRGDNQENRINNRGANQQGRIDNRGDWDRGGDDRGDGGGRSGGGGGGRGGGGGGGGRGGR